jgi:hypothetical protein
MLKIQPFTEASQLAISGKSNASLLSPAAGTTPNLSSSVLTGAAECDAKGDEVAPLPGNQSKAPDDHLQSETNFPSTVGLAASSYPSPEAQFDLVLSLAARGWRLHPIQAGGKAPLLSGWPIKASSKKEAIQSWATKYPYCNWAVACGAESNVFVLDVDDKHGKKGSESLSALEKQHGPLPTTLTSLTGSGKGRQYFFQYPTNADYLKNINNGALGDGLDVKVGGGYVVIPPSVTTVPYEFENKDAPLAHVPVCLLDKLKGLASGHHVPSDHTVDHQLILNGGRHKYLASLAGAMLRKGVSFEVLLAAMLAANKNHFLEPHPDTLIEKKAHDFYASWANKGSLDGGIAQAKRKLELIPLSQVQEQEIEWLWQPYLAYGMLTLLSGNPSVGKSFVTLAIAASLTAGREPYTDNPVVPAPVLYLSVENDPELVVAPRFKALNGNPNLFTIVPSVISGEGENERRESIQLADVDLLDAALEETRAKLVIIDPLQSYLGSQVDAHRANETRPLLDPIIKLAKKHNCCILLVRHLRKNGTGKALHQGLGSIDISGAARTELIAEYSPEDPNVRALAQVKSNVGKYGPALGFTIEQGHDGRPVFAWKGELPYTAEELLNPVKVPQGQAKLAQAEDFLQQVLADGPRLQKEIEAEATKAGIAIKTLNRAKKRLEIKPSKVQTGFKMSAWEWSLPEKQGASVHSQDGQDGGKVASGTSANLGHLGHLEKKKAAQLNQVGQHGQDDQHSHDGQDSQLYAPIPPAAALDSLWSESDMQALADQL